MTQQVNIDEPTELLIRKIAWNLTKAIPSGALIEYDDLYQVGLMAALEAIPRYDDNRGASINTFLGIRVRGAMLDELRRADPLTKGRRRKIKAGLEDDITEIQMNHSRTKSTDSDDTNDEEYDFWSDSTADIVFDEVLELELNELCAKHFSDTRQVMHLRLKGNMTLAEIGKVIGVTESRACQILGETTKHLRNIIAEA